MRSKQAVLFLKKKNQKNFCPFGLVTLGRQVSRRPPTPTEKSFFGSFFSKKEMLSGFTP
jgi:hypothetical protein